MFYYFYYPFNVRILIFDTNSQNNELLCDLVGMPNYDDTLNFSKEIRNGKYNQYEFLCFKILQNSIRLNLNLSNNMRLYFVEYNSYCLDNPFFCKDLIYESPQKSYIFGLCSYYICFNPQHYIKQMDQLPQCKNEYLITYDNYIRTLNLDKKLLSEFDNSELPNLHTLKTLMCCLNSNKHLNKINTLCVFNIFYSNNHCEKIYTMLNLCQLSIELYAHVQKEFQNIITLLNYVSTNTTIIDFKTRIIDAYTEDKYVTDYDLFKKTVNNLIINNETIETLHLSQSLCHYDQDLIEALHKNTTLIDVELSMNSHHQKILSHVTTDKKLFSAFIKDTQIQILKLEIYMHYHNFTDFIFDTIGIHHYKPIIVSLIYNNQYYYGIYDQYLRNHKNYNKLLSQYIE